MNPPNPVMLSVHTEAKAKVRVHADAVLFCPGGAYRGRPDVTTSRYITDSEIYAFSIIGPEQAVRAVASECVASNRWSRGTLRFVGPGGAQVTGKWGPGWSCQARTVCPGVMHMVACPPVSARLKPKEKHESNDDISSLVIAPPSGDRPATDADLGRAVYERLLLLFSTPLMPIGVLGQPPAEAEASLVWSRLLSAEIMREEGLWTPLVGHPEQTDTRWSQAGVLHITETQLDAMVTAMVEHKRLPFPVEAPVAAVA